MTSECIKILTNVAIRKLSSISIIPVVWLSSFLIHITSNRFSSKISSQFEHLFFINIAYILENNHYSILTLYFLNRFKFIIKPI